MKSFWTTARNRAVLGTGLLLVGAGVVPARTAEVDASSAAGAAGSAAHDRAAATLVVERVVRDISTSPRIRGSSGRVNAVVLHPGEEFPFDGAMPHDVRLEYVDALQPQPADTFDAAAGAGAWSVLVRLDDVVRRVPDVTVLTSTPLVEKTAGRIGSYRIGDWPYEDGSRPHAPAYAPPAGLVIVTPENAELEVSASLRLRDYVTKGQRDVWPKYVALNPLVLDKIEHTLDELRRSGRPAGRVGIISAFRTPNYNVNGGNTAGRANLSRHMYGDAVDLYIDDDGDGRMDDLNGDGRIDVGDARVLVAAAERVEKTYPHLIGGVGLYAPARGAHDGFVHVDVRGTPARW